MKQVVLKVPEKRYKFFMELMKSLGFVRIEKADEDDSKEMVIENLKSAFTELQEFRTGRKKGTPIKEFLDEI